VKTSALLVPHYFAMLWTRSTDRQLFAQILFTRRNARSREFVKRWTWPCKESEIIKQLRSLQNIMRTVVNGELLVRVLYVAIFGNPCGLTINYYLIKERW